MCGEALDGFVSGLEAASHLAEISNLYAGRFHSHEGRRRTDLQGLRPGRCAGFNESISPCGSGWPPGVHLPCPVLVFHGHDERVGRARLELRTGSWTGQSEPTTPIERRAASSVAPWLACLEHMADPVHCDGGGEEVNESLPLERRDRIFSCRPC